MTCVGASVRSILAGLFVALAFAQAAVAQNIIADPKLVAIPTFVEETASSGVASVYSGEWQYMVGGGVAAFDCDADGFPDILLAGGSSPANFYRNTSARGGPLKFVKETSGLEIDKVTGAYPLDIDGDGVTDLALLRVGENIVMRGLGHCKFERANEAWGFDGGDAWTAAFAATWEKGASWPTLAVGNYIDRSKEIDPWGSCTDNWLHRPLTNTDRKFAAPIPLKPSFCALSMLFTDWNRSGTPSLRVSNDREYYEGGQEQLWRVDPGKPPARYTEADGWKPIRIWGMGIASYDVNGDGYPDYALTSMADNRLQTLAAVPAGGAPRPTFKDMAFDRGVMHTAPIRAQICAPAPAGTLSSPTSTMTALPTCSSPKAMSTGCRTSPIRTRTICCCKCPTAPSGRRAVSPESTAPRPRAAPPWWISTWTGCSIWSWSTAVPTRKSGATPAPMPAIGSKSRSSWTARTATPSAPG